MLFFTKIMFQIWYYPIFVHLWNYFLSFFREHFQNLERPLFSSYFPHVTSLHSRQIITHTCTTKSSSTQTHSIIAHCNTRYFTYLPLYHCSPMVAPQLFLGFCISPRQQHKIFLTKKKIYLIRFSWCSLFFFLSRLFTGK